MYLYSDIVPVDEVRKSATRKPNSQERIINLYIALIKVFCIHVFFIRNWFIRNEYTLVEKLRNSSTMLKRN